MQVERAYVLRQARRIACVLAVGLVLPIDTAVAGPRPRLDAESLTARLAAGKAVVATDAVVIGALQLPAAVSAPLVLRNTLFTGPVTGVRTSFAGVVDFSGSRFRSGVDLRGAHFDGPLVLEGATVRSHARFGLARFEQSADLTGAQILGAASFVQATFRGATRFPDTTLGGRSDFRDATFEQAADFRGTHFHAVSFRDADFESIADFAGSDFEGDVLFRDARFSEFADFVGAQFDLGGPTWTSFAKASFDGGATFFRASFPAVSFSLSRARAPMDFESVLITGPADFDTVRFTDALIFARAQLEGALNLDQASVAMLDLGRAGLRKVFLPGKDGAGRLGGLRMDPDAIDAVAAPGVKLRQAAQVRALDTIEATANDENDLPAANGARIVRYELARDQKHGVDLLFDWFVWWGLFGYLVQPVHQLIAIGFLVVTGVTIRLAFGHHSPGADLRETLQSLFRLAPPDHGWVQLEYVAYKFVTVVLLINVGNVWPPFRDLLEGIL